MAEPGSTGYADVCVHGLRPTFVQYACHADPCVANIHCVNWAVAPEPSARTTGTILMAGSDSPGLSFLILGSAQFVIVPVKMPAMTGPDSRRLVTRCVPIFRLYMNVVPPAVSGM